MPVILSSINQYIRTNLMLSWDHFQTLSFFLSYYLLNYWDFP